MANLKLCVISLARKPCLSWIWMPSEKPAMEFRPRQATSRPLGATWSARRCPLGAEVTTGGGGSHQPCRCDAFPSRKLQENVKFSPALISRMWYSTTGRKNSTTALEFRHYLIIWVFCLLVRSQMLLETECNVRLLFSLRCLMMPSFLFDNNE